MGDHGSGPGWGFGFFRTRERRKTGVPDRQNRKLSVDRDPRKTGDRNGSGFGLRWTGNVRVRSHEGSAVCER